jgi:microcystin-dependent protein
MPPTYTTPSTNYSIHRVDGSTTVSDVDAAINQAVDDVDAKMVGRASGTLAARAGETPTDGKLYRTTDTGQVFMGTGAGWIEIGVSPWSPGDLKASWLTADHAGWLLCDGRAVSRATYAALFGAIGTSVSSGDGSTTFGLPDYRGRVIVMPSGASGVLADHGTRAAAWGASDHTLTAAQVPDLPIVGVNAGGTPPGNIGPGAIRGDQVGGGGNYSLATTGTGAFSFYLMADGGGGAHENRPPYLVCGGIFIRST